MRNGKSLLRCCRKLVVLAVVMLGMLGVAFSAYAAAPALEDTDSGAPSAMVMFPVTEKPSPFGAGMKPVVFNHLVHEKMIEDCETCHHTGDTVTCSSCHTVEGKKEGNFITLERAMHAENIAKRAGDATTPSSCVSCHTQNLKRMECAGCHSIMPTPPRAENYCASCHDVTTKMTKEQFMQGVKGELDAEENLTLATETVWERTQKQENNAKVFNVHSMPTTVRIDGLSKEFEGNLFNHKRHYTSLIKRMGEDKLGAAFHNDPLTLCAACHHQSPLSETPPKCVTCHSPQIDAKTPERPALKAAYHLQCMTCHDAMKVSRPANTSCVSCHTVRTK